MARQKRVRAASSPESVNSEVANNEHAEDQIIQDVSTPAAQQSEQNPPSRDWTRHKVTLVYVGAFLLIIALTLIFMFLKCYKVTDIKDILLAESGILSGPLGFIIGFYFKEELSSRE